MEVISFMLQGSMEEYWSSILPGPCCATLGVLRSVGIALGTEHGDKDQSVTCGSAPDLL